MDVPIIKIIAGVLWWIEIASLLILYAFFILERYSSVSTFRGLQMFFMLIGAIAILAFPCLDFPENIFFFLALPLGLNSVSSAEQNLKDKRIKKSKRREIVEC